MDNAQKAIMIGVGLFITIIIISAVLLIVNLGTNVTDEATNELGSMSSTMKNQITQKYDKTVLTGSEVRAAFQQYQNNDDLCVIMISKIEKAQNEVNMLSANNKAKKEKGCNCLIYSSHNSNGVVKTQYRYQIVMGNGAKALVSIYSYINNSKVDIHQGCYFVYDITSYNPLQNFGERVSLSDTWTKDMYPKATSALWNDSSNEYCYINPSKQYKSAVIKGKNDEIVGIAFQLKED